MKKFLCIIFTVFCVFGLSLQAMAEVTKMFVFDGSESLEIVTNTLKSGGEAKLSDKVLVLDGTYGVKLGNVGNVFSVSAMVKVSSTGGTNTIFFKDMDNEGNKWTGVISNGMKPALWTHGANHRWETVASGSENLGEWSHVAYVENNGVGSLYVNGDKVGSGNVELGEGCLYLGATYWSNDAFGGMVDNVKLFNTALTASEVMNEYEQYVDFENFIKLPGEVITDVVLTKKIASKAVTWTSSDESVIDTTGRVTRADEDKVVTLTASVDTGVIGVFEIKVLKKPVIVNDKVLLSYTFDKNDGEIIRDVSGNGNHGASYGNMEISENGAVFDGTDDYVKMPEGVLYGHDEITIVTTFTPNIAQQNVFLYGFGNDTQTGYMFLNPSTKSTNLIKFAATKTNAENEKAVASIPGVRNNEKATVAVSITDGYVRMYVDGELVMDGEIGFDISDLGKTAENYIGKSLYEADPYFRGVIEEFTVYGYCMSDEDLSCYKKKVQYAKNKANVEYITNSRAEYEHGKVKIVSDNDYSNGILIVAGYSASGALTGVALKAIDVKKGEKVELNGNFENATEFKLIYWKFL